MDVLRQNGQDTATASVRRPEREMKDGAGSAALSAVLALVCVCDAVCVTLRARRVYGGAENASTGKREYESAGTENASTENASTMQTFSQIKKKFGTSQVSVVYFQVGWASGLQIVFF